MQLLFDFFPVIAFFIAYKLTDIYVATGVIIVAVIVQTAVQWIRFRKVSAMSLISGTLVLVFGGLTLLIHDKSFIQWKVTIVNWLFAIGFAASQFIGERPLIERMLGDNMPLARPLWRRLNWAWSVFFLVLGGINLFVAWNFSESVWVDFKLFGVLGLTLVVRPAAGHVAGVQAACRFVRLITHMSSPSSNMQLKTTGTHARDAQCGAGHGCHRAHR